MSQVSLDKLSKKNKEFIHIATNQLLQDGKSDQEIQTILEGILPEESLPAASTEPQLLGQLL